MAVKFSVATTALTLLLNLGLALGNAGPATDKAGAKVSDLCGDARYARFAAKQIQASFESALQELPALFSTATAYRLAAAAAPTKELFIALSALGIVQDKNARETAAAISSAAAKYLLAGNLLKLREGRVTAIARATLGTPQASASNLNINNANYKSKANTYGCQMTVTFSEQPGTNCSFEADSDSAVKEIEVNLDDATQIKLLNDESLANQKLQLQAAAMGTVSSAGTAVTQAYAACTNDGNAIGGSTAAFIAAEITAKNRATSAKTANLYETGTTGKCRQTRLGTDWGEQQADSIANALCEVRSNKLNIPQPLHKQGLTALEGNADIILALSQLRGPGKDVPTETDARKTLVHTYFGNSQQAYAQTIVKLIEQTSIDIQMKPTNIKGTAITLAVSDDGVKALSYYIGRDLDSKEENKAKPANPVISKELTDKCKTITDKEKCKTTDECELKGEKCVAKTTIEGVVTGSQNTTGSNSFVIKKAPLWLAVLLF